MRTTWHLVNAAAFCMVIGFFMGSWESSFELLCVVALAASLNVTVATLAVFRFATRHPERARLTNLAAMLIGICYVAGFVVFEWQRVK